MVRRLNLLVTTLTITMILGLIAITVMIFLTFQRARNNGADLALPDEIALPAGERLQTLSTTERWLVVVTQDEAGQERVHIYEPDGQRILQSVTIRNN